TFRKAFIGVFVVPALLILATTYGMQKLRPVVQLDEEFRTYGTDVCHGNFAKQCIRGDRNQSPTVLMFGDSHAAMLNSFIDVVGEHEGWAASLVSSAGCSPVFNFDHTILPASAHVPCRALKEYVALEYQKYDAVLFATLWARHLGMRSESADNRYLEKLEITLRQM